MQRRMLRVFFQQFESFVSEIADGSRKCVVAGPKFWLGKAARLGAPGEWAGEKFDGSKFGGLA